MHRDFFLTMQFMYIIICIVVNCCTKNAKQISVHLCVPGLALLLQCQAQLPMRANGTSSPWRTEGQTRMWNSIGRRNAVWAQRNAVQGCDRTLQPFGWCRDPFFQIPEQYWHRQAIAFMLIWRLIWRDTTWARTCRRSWFCATTKGRQFWWLVHFCSLFFIGSIKKATVDEWTWEGACQCRSYMLKGKKVLVPAKMRASKAEIIYIPWASTDGSSCEGVNPRAYRLTCVCAFSCFSWLWCWRERRALHVCLTPFNVYVCVCMSLLAVLALVTTAAHSRGMNAKDAA